MSIRKIAAVIVLIAVVFLAGMWVPKFLGGSSKDSGDNPSARKVHKANNGNAELTLDKETQDLSGIVTEKLSAFSSKAKVKAFGQVLDAQSLIELRNSYATAKANVKKSIAALEVSRNEYKRVKTLFDFNKNVSEKDLQSAEAAYVSDMADSQAAVQNLSGLEGEIRQQWGKVIETWIAEDSVTMGKLINHEMSILLITIPPGVTINEMPHTVDVQTLGGMDLRAAFVSLSPRTNPDIQGVSFFYRLSGSSAIQSGMNVVAYLPTGKKVEGVIIPDSAVVWWNGNAWVYVKEGQDKFVRQEISTSDRVRKGWFVSGAMMPGDEIVVKGAQLLLSSEGSFGQEFKAQAKTGTD